MTRIAFRFQVTEQGGTLRIRGRRKPCPVSCDFLFVNSQTGNMQLQAMEQKERAEESDGKGKRVEGREGKESRGKGWEGGLREGNESREEGEKVEGRERKSREGTAKQGKRNARRQSKGKEHKGKR